METRVAGRAERFRQEEFKPFYGKFLALPLCYPVVLFAGRTLSAFSVSLELCWLLLYSKQGKKNTENLRRRQLHQLFMRPNMLVYMLMGPQAANNVMGWRAEQNVEGATGQTGSDVTSQSS